MRKVYLLVVIVGMGLAAFWLWPGQSNKLLAVTFFDVGQGDSALIRTPDEQYILIDGGPDRTILKKLGEYLPWTTKEIDLVVLSHPHADHVAGLNHVLERYQVGHVVMTGALHTTPEYLKFLSLLKDKNIPVTIATAGKSFTLAGGVVLEVLWPQESMAEQRVNDLNKTSIVNRVVYSKTTILFTGDTPAENEMDLVNKQVDLSASILKVAHQGSKTSSTEAFVRAVSSQVAIISVGKNNYGHPHEEVIKRLANMVAVVLRTDQEGDITYFSDGQTIWRQK